MGENEITTEITEPYIEAWRGRDDKVVDLSCRCTCCNAYICFCTEYNIEDIYRYCTHCGRKIDWKTFKKRHNMENLEDLEEKL